jgi:hypothetical protein
MCQNADSITSSETIFSFLVFNSTTNEGSQQLPRKFGQTLTIEDKTSFAYPTPQHTSFAPINEVQQVGLSVCKAEYIHSTSKMARWTLKK